jgi:hypothetical protein
MYEKKSQRSLTLHHGILKVHVSYRYNNFDLPPYFKLNFILIICHKISYLLNEQCGVQPRSSNHPNGKNVQYNCWLKVIISQFSNNFCRAHVFK